MSESRRLRVSASTTCAEGEVARPCSTGSGSRPRCRRARRAPRGAGPAARRRPPTGRPTIWGAMRSRQRRTVRRAPSPPRCQSRPPARTVVALRVLRQRTTAYRKAGEHGCMTTILITGANKSLGKETARLLVEARHTVWIGARDAGRGRATATSSARGSSSSTSRTMPRSGGPRDDRRGRHRARRPRQQRRHRPARERCEHERGARRSQRPRRVRHERRRDRPGDRGGAPVAGSDRPTRSSSTSPAPSGRSGRPTSRPGRPRTSSRSPTARARPRCRC